MSIEEKKRKKKIKRKEISNKTSTSEGGGGREATCWNVWDQTVAKLEDMVAEGNEDELLVVSRWGRCCCAVRALRFGVKEVFPCCRCYYYCFKI